MGEILGLGCTHYPGMTVPDERLAASFHRLLTALGVSDYYKDRANWPAELRNDQCYSVAQRYSARMGEMETLHRRPAVQDYVETHIFMSEKCFVSYPAQTGGAPREGC